MKRHEINTQLENQIITGLIVSTKFCKEVLPILKQEHFDIEYSRIVLRWVFQYYSKYNESPGKHIQDIFEEKKASIKPEQLEMISSFLTGLSERYSEEENFNIAYLVDKTRSMAGRKNMLRLVEEAKSYIEGGKLDEADRLFLSFKAISEEISQHENPFDEKTIMKASEWEEESLFNLSGKLGELVPNGMKRGWLVAFMSPMKRGKSWFLMETAVQAAMSRLKVVYITLEMEVEEICCRIYRRITSMPMQEDTYLFPVFDCLRNQDGSCKNPSRTNRIALVGEEGVFPKFENAPQGYRPCSVCRGKDKNSFDMVTWWESHKHRAMSINRLKKTLHGFKMMKGDNIRMISYPTGTANIQKISHDLDMLELEENFVPDVIVIDYADIMGPEEDGEDERSSHDTRWKKLRGLAMFRHCLLVTATQSTRKTLDAKTVKGSDTSQEIRKAAHANLMYGIHQTPGEKRRGIVRLSTLFLRSGSFDVSKQVTVLQQLDLGQVILDSETGRVDVVEEKE